MIPVLLCTVMTRRLSPARKLPLFLFHCLFRLMSHQLLLFLLILKQVIIRSGHSCIYKSCTAMADNQPDRHNQQNQDQDESNDQPGIDVHFGSWANKGEPHRFALVECLVNDAHIDHKGCL